MAARLWGGNLGWFVFWGYQLFIVLAATGYLAGITQSKEYAEPEWYVDLWLTLVWVMYLLAFGGTLLRREEQGLLTTGWTRGVYPTEQTALDALTAGTLYVLEDEGRVTAAAKIDQHQMPQYAQCSWQYEAPPERVLVLHTLVVDPAVKGKGYGTAFVRFYEQLGRETGRNCLRIDTNARNTPARALYKKLGYTEAGIVAGTFNGIPDVQLVCLEKKV